MQAIDEFVAQQTAHNEAISTALTGITADIESLNAKILELSDGPSELDPADQALLDDLLVASASLAQRVTALDELTPPVPPVEPPSE